VSNHNPRALGEVREIEESEESKYTQLPATWVVKFQKGNGIGFSVNGADDWTWLPLSQVRKDSAGQLYASNWIIEQKDLSL
jgi:hypothetical protein